MTIPQSIQAARKRLDAGLCPVHGLVLRPIAEVEEDEAGNPYVTVQCACPVIGWYYPATRSFELAAAFGHLIAAGRA